MTVTRIWIKRTIYMCVRARACVITPKNEAWKSCFNGSLHSEHKTDFFFSVQSKRNQVISLVFAWDNVKAQSEFCCSRGQVSSHIHAGDALMSAYGSSHKLTTILALLQPKLKRLEKFLSTFPSIKFYEAPFKNSAVLICAGGKWTKQFNRRFVRNAHPYT